MTPKRYVGLANYRELWSPEFGEVLVNTACYSGGVVVLALGLGLAFALLLNDRSRLSAALQACIFSSYIVSWVAVSLLWVWMLGYPLVIYLAGLQAIPGDFYEAAAL